MNDIQIFKNPEFGAVRTVAINGEPWLVGRDVAAALGYSNTRDAISRHVDAEDKGVVKRDTLGGTQEMTIINESGLYSLVLSSKLPSAKKFKHWITAEVLPSIRKTGVYATPEALERLIADPTTTIRLLEELKKEQDQRKALQAENETQRQTIEDMEPKMEYLDTILESPGTVTTTQIAADYGISARKLNDILHEAGIQHCVNGQWILYRRLMGKGYTKSRTVNITHADGTPDTKMTTRWTQKGRLMIHEVLETNGIKAVMDKE